MSYAIVPREPTEEMHVAAVRTIQRCNGNADFPPRVYRAMIIAAPPPPGQVLSEDDIDALFDEWHDSPEDINGLIRRAERAVLKQLGAKNV